MDFNRIADDKKVDMERARKCVEAYSQSTGVGCAVIDAKGAGVYESCSKACSFCRKVRSILGSHDFCKNAHLYGSYQAERFGGKYVFFCPIGLTHWASPVMSDSSMQYALLGGPVFMIEPEEFLMDDLILKNNIDEKHLAELKESMKEVPVIKPGVVDGMSEMLFITAVHISGVQTSQYLEDRKYLEQQSDISEYIHYIKTIGGDDNSPGGYPLEKEKELLSLISMGDKPGSQKVLNEIFGHIFFSTGGNFEIIKARVLELVVLLSRAALEGGADIEQIFGLNYKHLSRIHDFKTVDELTYWLSKIMGRFTDCVFNFTNIKHADVIYKAIDYIKRNYMKKLSLEEVASHVYLSPSYFSKVFKDEMGCNFVTYLNQIRIKVSKGLLLDDSIDLVEISNLVGYEDQSYFSKSFKKLTGVTPGKFRECRGQVKNLLKDE